MVAITSQITSNAWVYLADGSEIEFRLFWGWLFATVTFQLELCLLLDYRLDVVGGNSARVREPQGSRLVESRWSLMCCHCQAGTLLPILVMNSLGMGVTLLRLSTKTNPVLASAIKVSDALVTR